MIGMKCPKCGSARISRRMPIDPPAARILFYPCSQACAAGAKLCQVIYTDAQRNPIAV